MTTTEQPDNHPLTRKELRQIRNTAATPIVTTTPEPSDDGAEESVPAEVAPPAPVPAVALARPAVPVDVPPAPIPDATVDLGVSPLTRRQARQQERIRTASVPVITPDLIAAHSGVVADAGTAHPPYDVGDLFAELAPGLIEPPADVDPGAAVAEAVVPDAPALAEAEPDAAEEQDVAEESAAASDRPLVNPAFGSELLGGDASAVTVSPSFDELLTRDASTSGSIATPNALILSQTPTGTILGPVAATGELLITGTFALPEGLGSQGHAPGTADGKEADAVLVDGELPAHSSPTPIAASAAISTVKATGEIIRPPAPEKGNKLMLALAITAGALAVALFGVLILAFVTGVFR